MSASSPSRSISLPRASEALEQRRRLTLQLVCAGYWLYLLLHGLFVPVPHLGVLGPHLLTAYLSAVAFVLSLSPQINFRSLTLLLMALLTPLVLIQMSAALASGQSPTGYLGWLPALFCLGFVILNWRLASVLAAVVILNVVRCLLVFPGRSPQNLDAWLSELTVLLTMSVVGAVISRFFEERLQSGHEAGQKLEAARMDALTQVLGRAAAEEQLEDGIRHAKDARQPLSLLLCDLDNFKAINDRHGHPAGDAVLQAAARRLRRHIGKIGQVGRWGGEEFVVILPGITKTDALMLAEQLRRDLSFSDLAGIPVTASFGVSAYRVGDDTSELFGRADQRLYEAKNAGRNLVRG